MSSPAKARPQATPPAVPFRLTKKAAKPRVQRVEKVRPSQTPENAALPHHIKHAELDVLALSGAVTGAATGALAGPPGAIAGAVIGAIAGAVIGGTLDREETRKHNHDEELDREIGVSEGDLGTDAVEHPPTSRGTFSSASSGADGAKGSTAEGPIQSLDDD